MHRAHKLKKIFSDWARYNYGSVSITLPDLQVMRVVIQDGQRLELKKRRFNLSLMTLQEIPINQEGISFNNWNYLIQYFRKCRKETDFNRKQQRIKKVRICSLFLLGPFTIDRLLLVIICEHVGKLGLVYMWGISYFN